MGDLPGPGLEPVSPALAGGFLTTAPPGKSQEGVFYSLHTCNIFSLSKVLRNLIMLCLGEVLFMLFVPGVYWDFQICEVIVYITFENNLPLFFQIFFSPSHYGGSNYMYIACVKLSHTAHCTLCLILDSFYCCVFKFSQVFFGTV